MAQSPNSVLFTAASSSNIDWFEDKGHVGSLQEEILQFSENLKKKRAKYKKEADYWKHVYYKVHRKYLKRYRSPSTLEDVLVTGEYDCLSGTALYALIFQELGADYHIIETNYHVYLTINVAGETILIEATSPLEGFVSDGDQVKKLQEIYTNNFDDGDWTDINYYKLQQVLNNPISLQELRGLQYYNLAVQAYNNQDLAAALDLQDKALGLYPCGRLEEMMAVMLKTLEKDLVLDSAFKEHYLTKYQKLRQWIIVAYRK